MLLNTLPMFDIKKINVADEEIHKVEEKFGFKFNDGQLSLIKHWESVDIQACPGSGKTTTLAAKLLLLSQKLPSTFTQGICIITHTNIAVDEIKEKLGNSARIFFQYPNHFGTIQSFVDKYLTIPYYKKLYKASPKIVDEYAYQDVISNLPELVASKTVDFLDRKNIFLRSLIYNRHNFEISKNVNQADKFTIKGLKQETCNKYYQKIHSAKSKVLSYGYLTYDEAYSLAFKYIREFPLILKVIRERFPLVFVDEMQDMEDHQSALINALFEKSTIIQKIGDINQSIFSARASEDENEWKPIINKDIQLKISNRLPENIASIVKDICCKPQQMVGRHSISPIKPIVFVYNDDTILNVKDEFAKRVLENGLASSGRIKIIGSRVSESRLNIASYWPDYNRVFEKIHFDNLDSYLNYLTINLSTIKNVKKLRFMFLTIICDCIKICKIRNPVNDSYFTPFSFVKHMNDLGHEDKILKMQIRFAHWIIKIKQSVSIKEELIAVINGIIKFFDGTQNKGLEKFYKRNEITIIDVKPENKIYTYVQGDDSIEIHFDTIHGVKGETHSATLYLETYTRAYDIGEKILNFIIADENGKKKQRKNNACYRRLPHAYVALTRATDLVAIAVHNKRFLPEHKEYFEKESNGWELVFV